MKRSGFTLIEMLVVVAIISILAGVVLTGVTGFQANARDTKRIGDLKLVQNYLELYFNKWGHYPGDVDGDTTAVTTWAELQAALVGLNVTLPNDPVRGRTYYYATETTDVLRYILGAELERDNNALNNPQEIDATTGFTNVPSGMDCADASLGYCTGS